MLEASARVDARITTARSFGQHAESNWRHPNSLCAASKNAFGALVDYYAVREGLCVRSVVPYDVYGAGDPRRKLLALVIEAALSGEPLELSRGFQLVNLTHVDDVVAGVVQCVHTRPSAVAPEIVSLRSAEFLSIRAVVDVVEQALKRPVAARWGARPDRPGEMREPWDVAPVLAGWVPRIGLADGICEAAAASAR